MVDCQEFVWTLSTLAWNRSFDDCKPNHQQLAEGNINSIKSRMLTPPSLYQHLHFTSACMWNALTIWRSYCTSVQSAIVSMHCSCLFVNGKISNWSNSQKDLKVWKFPLGVSKAMKSFRSFCECSWMESTVNEFRGCQSHRGYLIGLGCW